MSCTGRTAKPPPAMLMAPRPAFWLLPGIADLAANMLSAVPMPRGINSYHSVTLVPVLTVAAIQGVRRLATRFAGDPVTRLTNYVLCFTLTLGYFFSPLPLTGAANPWAPAHLRGAPDPALPKVRAVVGDHASVSAQANIAAHFSQRGQVYLFPDKAGTADAVVLWLDTPTRKILPHSRGFIGTTAHHLQLRPAEYLAAIECLLNNRGYGVVLWEDPWLVVSRGAATGSEDRQVREKLQGLCKAWAVPEKEYAAAVRACRSDLL